MPESPLILMEQSAADAQRQAENDERLRVGLSELLDQLQAHEITDAEADAFLAEPPDPRFANAESMARMRARYEALCEQEKRGELV